MTDSSTPTVEKCPKCHHDISKHKGGSCNHLMSFYEQPAYMCGCSEYFPDPPSPTIEALEAFADEQRGRIKIYSIFRRNAGWAIQWYEPERQQKELPGTGEESYHYGLVVYQYYPTFGDMVTQEFKRLKESK